jgi:predicted Fe-Mo cluster-binding NifX family protein
MSNIPQEPADTTPSAAARRTIVMAAEDLQGLDASMSAHFGRCPAYTVAEVEEGTVQAVRVVENPWANAHQPGVMPRFIHSLGADVIIAGGMGPRAIQLFDQLGVEVVTGCLGRVGAVLEAYLAGDVKGVVPCAHHHGDGGGGCGGH